MNLVAAGLKIARGKNCLAIAQRPRAQNYPVGQKGNNACWSRTARDLRRQGHRRANARASGSDSERGRGLRLVVDYRIKILKAQLQPVHGVLNLAVIVAGRLGVRPDFHAQHRPPRKVVGLRLLQTLALLLNRGHPRRKHAVVLERIPLGNKVRLETRILEPLLVPD